MNTIKTCPFCESEGKLIDHDWAGECDRRPDVKYGVGCSKNTCWACADWDSHCYEKTKEAAITLWNKRI